MRGLIAFGNAKFPGYEFNMESHHAFKFLRQTAKHVQERYHSWIVLQECSTGGCIQRLSKAKVSRLCEVIWFGSKMVIISESDLRHSVHNSVKSISRYMGQQNMPGECGAGDKKSATTQFLNGNRVCVFRKFLATPSTLALVKETLR